jgi:hypothetical protein
LAEYGANYNHGGFEARFFCAYAYWAGLFPRVSADGRLPHARENGVTSVVDLRTFANSSSVPILIFVRMQQEYLAQPRLPAISWINCAGQLPKGSGSFARDWSAGHVHPHAQ